MDTEKLRQLLDSVQQGQTTIDVAMERLRQLPYEDLGFARLTYIEPCAMGCRSGILPR